MTSKIGLGNNLFTVNRLLPNHIYRIIEIVGTDSISAQIHGQNRAEMDSAPTTLGTGTGL